MHVTGQTTNYWTCAVPTMTLKTQGALPHPQLRMSCGPQFPFLGLSPSCMWVLWCSHVCSVPIRTRMDYIRLPSLANLSHVYLIIRLTERTASVEACFFFLHRPNTFKQERLWIHFAPVSVGKQTANLKDEKLKDKRSPNSCLPRISFP